MKERGVLSNTVSDILANGTKTRDSDNVYHVSWHSMEIILRKYQCKIVLDTVVRR